MLEAVAVSGPQTVPIDAIGTVRTADVATSPVSAARAAAFRIEVYERNGPVERALGVVVVGDVLALALDDGTRLDVVVRRAEWATLSTPAEIALTTVPPELVPLLSHGHGRGGTLVCREHALRQGDRVRVRATVERSDERLVAREDRAPVRLAEVLLER